MVGCSEVFVSRVSIPASAFLRSEKKGKFNVYLVININPEAAFFSPCLCVPGLSFGDMVQYKKTGRTRDMILKPWAQVAKGHLLTP